MKYIRTKEGQIVDFLLSKKEYEENYHNSNVSYDRWFELASDGYNILKQADTIEELCDEFVATLKNTKPYIFKDGEYKELEKKPSEWLGTLFGAIWTDKGLIYVAKMNEKGELELL